MKAQSMINKTVTQVISGLIAMVVVVPAIAQESVRKPVDAKSPYASYAKIVGEISQIAKDSTSVGNAFFVGNDGCNIATNFHVAFGKSKDSNGKVVMVDNVEVGHVVNFSMDFDSKTGKFKRQVRAKVVEFGNYQAGTTRGFLGDVAILRLENCVGKEYAGPELDHPEPGKHLPSGKLITVSTTRISENKNEILVQDGCYAEKATPVTGMLPANCEAVDGMSGSMVLEEGADGKLRLVGLSTKQSAYKDGREVLLAIYSKVLTPFIEGVVGGEAAPALAVSGQDRAPQSDLANQTASVKPRTVVR